MGTVSGGPAARSGRVPSRDLLRKRPTYPSLLRFVPAGRRSPADSAPIGNYWEFLASLAPFSWLCVLLWVDRPVPLHAPGLCFARS